MIWLAFSFSSFRLLQCSKPLTSPMLASERSSLSLNAESSDTEIGSSTSLPNSCSSNFLRLVSGILAITTSGSGSSCKTVAPVPLNSCMIDAERVVNGFCCKSKTVRLLRLDNGLMSLIWLEYKYNLFRLVRLDKGPISLIWLL